MTNASGAGHARTPDSRSRSVERPPSYRPVWLATVLGTSLTLVAALAFYHWDHQTASERTHIEFYSIAIDRLEAVRRDILLDLEVVQALQAFFRSSRRVREDEFHAFAKPLLERRPGIHALAWAPRRGARFPLQFLERVSESGLGAGLDLGVEPARRAALEQARDEARVVATKALPLGEGAGGGTAVVLFAPVYRGGPAPDTVAARRARLSGFIVGVFAVERLVEHALAGLTARGIDVWLFDATEERDALLHWRPAPEVARDPGAAIPAPEAATRHVKESITVGGRSWALAAGAAPGRFLPRVSNAHWIALGAGLALTALLAAYLGTLLRTAAARLRTEHQLRRLNRTHAVLSSCNSALARAQDESGLLDGFCRNIVEVGGYRMAWVGLLDDERRHLRPMAAAGHAHGYTEALDLACAEGAPDLEPAAQAVRSGRPLVIQDLDVAPVRTRWRAEAQARGCGSVIALPLASGGAPVGALAIYAEEAHAFDPDEAILLDELAGDLVFGITSFRNTAERDHAQASLRLRERAIESSLDGIMLTDFRRPGCPIVYVNPAFNHITGYTLDEVAGRNPSLLQGADRDQPELEEIRSAIEQRRHGAALLRNYRKDGSLFWNELHIAPVRDELNEVTHYVGIINDVTERVRYQHELEHQANHDSLTGLANRNLLQDRIEQALQQGRRRGSAAGVVMLDLDRFKNVNDSLGHEAGDNLLRTVAARLAHCVRAGDTVARQGGDEFVLVLPDIQRPNEISIIVNRALEAVSQPVCVDEHELIITACVGASVFPKDGENAEMLLKNADAAMYRAKAQGPNTFRFYQASMNASALQRLTLERRLRQALEQEAFELHYQPQAELKSGKIVGLEALVRWRTSEGELVSPGEFIPLAEETGLIVPLGEWVLAEACRQARAWHQRGLAPMRIAVNVSAQQFRQQDLYERIARVLKETGLASERLELEVTESAVMADPEEVIATLSRLKELGVQLTLDDFGTGYSSLAYLKRFPIDRVKIDRSFVRNIPHDADDAAIALTVIAMAHGMSLKVTAEGVETQAQLDYLRQHGCDELQGFYLARPLPAREVPRFLRNLAEQRPAPKRAAG